MSLSKSTNFSRGVLKIVKSEHSSMSMNRKVLRLTANAITVLNDRLIEKCHRIFESISRSMDAAPMEVNVAFDAVTEVFPGELKSHAISEGNRNLVLYNVGVLEYKDSQVKRRKTTETAGKITYEKSRQGIKCLNENFNQTLSSDALKLISDSLNQLSRTIISEIKKVNAEGSIGAIEVRQAVITVFSGTLQGLAVARISQVVATRDLCTIESSVSKSKTVRGKGRTAKPSARTPIITGRKTRAAKKSQVSTRTKPRTSSAQRKVSKRKSSAQRKSRKRKSSAISKRDASRSATAKKRKTSKSASTKTRAVVPVKRPLSKSKVVKKKGIVSKRATRTPSLTDRKTRSRKKREVSTGKKVKKSSVQRKASKRKSSAQRKSRKRKSSAISKRDASRSATAKERKTSKSSSTKTRAVVPVKRPVSKSKAVKKKGTVSKRATRTSNLTDRKTRPMGTKAKKSSAQRKRKTSKRKSSAMLIRDSSTSVAAKKRKITKSAATKRAISPVKTTKTARKVVRGTTKMAGKFTYENFERGVKSLNGNFNQTLSSDALKLIGDSLTELSLTMISEIKRGNSKGSIGAKEIRQTVITVFSGTLQALAVARISQVAAVFKY